MPIHYLQFSDTFPCLLQFEVCQIQSLFDTKKYLLNKIFVILKLVPYNGVLYNKEKNSKGNTVPESYHSF